MIPNPDPLQTSIPYKETDFTIGFLSSIIHTFTLIFFAELGDKTFIMLFILQLRTNKVTIFYAALIGEILMNSFACFLGFIINYLLYQNFIDYLGILFFFIYGIFLFLWGFKKKDETFEAEFEEINNMLQSRKRRSSLVILGVEKEDINNKDLIEDDKYNLNSVNDINNKTYVPNFKRELTIIPEGDISREDSIIDNSMLLSGKAEKNDDDNDFVLSKKNNLGFSLNLRKPKKSNESNEPKKKSSKDLLNDTNNSNNANKNMSSGLIVSNVSNSEEDEDEEENQKDDEEKEIQQLRATKKNYKSRYYLDYFDKNINVELDYIDTKVFGTIFFTFCLSEFGDRTQLISLTASSIFNFWGSLLGSCTALFCSCLLGVYYTKPVIKTFKQKYNDLILGIIFLASGIQIYIFKLKNQSAI